MNLLFANFTESQNGEYLKHLWLAVEILLVTNSLQKLQEMLIKPDDESKLFDLHTNFEKTQMMVDKKFDKNIEIKCRQ